MAWLVLDVELPNQKLPPPPANLPKCQGHEHEDQNNFLFFILLSLILHFVVYCQFFFSSVSHLCFSLPRIVLWMGNIFWLRHLINKTNSFFGHLQELCTLTIQYLRKDYNVFATQISIIYRLTVSPIFRHLQFRKRKISKIFFLICNKDQKQYVDNFQELNSSLRESIVWFLIISNLHQTWVKAVSQNFLTYLSFK